MWQSTIKFTCWLPMTLAKIMCISSLNSKLFQDLDLEYDRKILHFCADHLIFFRAAGISIHKMPQDWTVFDGYVSIYIYVFVVLEISEYNFLLLVTPICKFLLIPVCKSWFVLMTFESKGIVTSLVQYLFSGCAYLFIRNYEN